VCVCEREKEREERDDEDGWMDGWYIKGISFFLEIQNHRSFRLFLLLLLLPPLLSSSSTSLTYHDFTRTLSSTYDYR